MKANFNKNQIDTIFNIMHTEETHKLKVFNLLLDDCNKKFKITYYKIKKVFIIELDIYYNTGFSIDKNGKKVLDNILVRNTSFNSTRLGYSFIIIEGKKKYNSDLEYKIIETFKYIITNHILINDDVFNYCAGKISFSEYLYNRQKNKNI